MYALARMACALFCVRSLFRFEMCLNCKWNRVVICLGFEHKQCHLYNMFGLHTYTHQKMLRIKVTVQRIISADSTREPPFHRENITNRKPFFSPPPPLPSPLAVSRTIFHLVCQTFDAWRQRNTGINWFLFISRFLMSRKQPLSPHPTNISI